MGLDVGGIDRGRSVDARQTRQSIKDIGPNPLTAPAIEAIVDRRVRPVDLRAITPARPTAQHVNDAANHPAIINPTRPAPPADGHRSSGLLPV
jgi:hypothetical protein